jgi:hypothetical protein
MTRKSRSEILESRMVDQRQAIIDDPGNPGYVKMRAMGTLNSLLCRRDKRQAEKDAAAAARCAERKADQPVMSWLPERGEGGDAYHARMARQKAQLTSAD